MPIHIACLCGHWVNIVKYLITEMKCSPSSLVSHLKHGFKTVVLHFILLVRFCLSGSLDLIQYLISEHGCDPAVVDTFCITPLHVACMFGFATVVQWILQDRRTDALSVSRFGRTPVDYAELSNNSYELLKLFKPLLQSRMDYPIHSFTKAILTGNSLAGKSSLAKVIIEQATMTSCHSFKKSQLSDSLPEKTSFGTREVVLSLFRDDKDQEVNFSPYYCDDEEEEEVTKMETLTAGIDSYVVKSESFGNMVLYDLAGQSEYYFSQSVIMETVLQKTPAIFINLVDLSKSEEEITQAIHHWLTFIENAIFKTQENSCVVMVGSHIDLLNKQQLKTKARLVKDLVDRRVKKLVYEGFVGMDCREVNSEITSKFFPLLLNCHTAISAYSPPVSVYCHMLYAFLQTKLDKTACQLQELASILAAEEDSLVPSKLPLLSELLEDLSSKGVIIYLKNKQCLDKSWVVVKREVILKDVNGELFKPKYFSGYHPIASSTGIIRMSTLMELFPQYDPQMLVELMVRLEFCHPVNLSGITTNLQPLSASSTDSSTEKFLFFPSLLHAVAPLVW